MSNSLFIDNPILLKHIRARLRKAQLVPFIVVVALLSALFCWMGFAPLNGGSSGYASESTRTTAFSILFGLQCLLLFVLGACQVAGSVATAREGGQLDFHRISPQRPLAIAVGYLLGAPIRELVLFACTLPFMLPFIIMGNPFWLGFGLPVLFLAMLPAAFFWYCFALLLGVMLPKPRNVAVLVAIVIGGAHLLYTIPFMQHFTIIATMQSTISFSYSYHTASMDNDLLRNIMSFFFTIPIPYVILGVIHQLILGAFCLYAAKRKLTNELAYPFSRPVALLFFTVFAALLLGVIINPTMSRYSDSYSYDYSGMALFCLYGLLVIGLILLAICTPARSEIIKGIRHVRKLGRHIIPVWDDRAPNTIFLISITALTALFCAIGIAIIDFLLNRENSISQQILPINVIYATVRHSLKFEQMALGLLVVIGATLFFGAALQYCQLKFRKQGATLFGMLLFLLWILPILIAFVVSIVTNSSSNPGAYILAISPLSSITELLIDATDYLHPAIPVLAIAIPWLSGLFFFIMSMHEARKLTLQPESAPPAAAPAGKP